MTSISVLENTTLQTVYPSLFEMTTLGTVAATSMTAFQDYDSIPQDFTLAASSNVRVEAVENVQVYFGNQKNFELYNTTYDALNQLRTDEKIFGITAEANQTVVLMGNNEAKFVAGDLNQTFFFNDFQIQDNNDFKTIQTDALNGIKFMDKVSFGSSLYMGDDLVVNGNAYTKGSLVGKELALFKDKDMSTITENDPLRVGYALRINANDQLEVIKYTRFLNGLPDAQKKVAVFGMNGLGFSDSNYIPDLDVYSRLGGTSFTTGTAGAYKVGSAETPSLGGSVALDLTKYTNIVIELADNADSLSLSFLPSTFTADMVGHKGTITISERSTTGRTLASDARVTYTMIGNDGTSTTPAPTDGYAIDQITYTVMTTTTISATYIPISTYTPPVVGIPYVFWDNEIPISTVGSKAAYTSINLYSLENNYIVLSGYRSDPSLLTTADTPALVFDGLTPITGYHMTFSLTLNRQGVVVDGLKVYTVNNLELEGSANRYVNGHWGHSLQTWDGGKVIVQLGSQIQTGRVTEIYDLSNTLITSINSTNFSLPTEYGFIAVVINSLNQALCKIYISENIWGASSKPVEGGNGNILISGLYKHPRDQTNTLITPRPDANYLNLSTDALGILPLPPILDVDTTTWALCPLYSMSNNASIQWSAYYISKQYGAYREPVAFYENTSSNVYLLTGSRCSPTTIDYVIDGNNITYDFLTKTTGYSATKVLQFSSSGAFLWGAEVFGNTRGIEPVTGCLTTTGGFAFGAYTLWGDTFVPTNARTTTTLDSPNMAYQYDAGLTTAYNPIMFIAVYNSDGTIKWTNIIKNIDAVRLLRESFALMKPTYDDGIIMNVYPYSSLISEYDSVTNSTFILYNADKTTVFADNIVMNYQSTLIVKYNASGNVAWYVKVLANAAENYTKVAINRVLTETTDHSIVYGAFSTFPVTVTDANGATKTFTGNYIFTLTEFGTFL